MLVCKCINVDYDAISDAVKECGADMELVMDKTGAGTACGCCKKEACPKVELPLPGAIAKATAAN